MNVHVVSVVTFVVKDLLAVVAFEELVISISVNSCEIKIFFISFNKKPMNQWFLI